MSVAVVRQLEPAAKLRDTQRVRHYEYRDSKFYNGFLPFERWQWYVLMKIASGASQERLVTYTLFDTVGSQRNRRGQRTQEWTAPLSYSFVASLLDVTDTAARNIVADACRRKLLTMRAAREGEHKNWKTTFCLKPLVDEWEYVLPWEKWRTAQDKLLKFARDTGEPWTSPLSCAAIAEMLKVPEADAGLIVADAIERNLLEMKLAGRSGEFTLRYIPPQKEDAAEKAGEEESNEDPTAVGNSVVITEQPLVLMPGRKARPVPLPMAVRGKLSQVEFDVRDLTLAIHAAAEGASLKVTIGRSATGFPERNGKNPTGVGNPRSEVIDLKGLQRALNPAVRKRWRIGLDTRVITETLTALGDIPARAVIDEFVPIVEARLQRRPKPEETPLLIARMAQQFRADWNERQAEVREQQEQQETRQQREYEVAQQEIELYECRQRYEAVVIKATDAHIAGQSVERRLREHMRQIQQEAPQFRWTDQALREQAWRKLREEIAAELELPTFEEFAQQEVVREG